MGLTAKQAQWSMLIVPRHPGATTQILASPFLTCFISIFHLPWATALVVSLFLLVSSVMPSMVSNSSEGIDPFSVVLRLRYTAPSSPHHEIIGAVISFYTHPEALVLVL
jgi:hypothetical protein